MNAFLEFQLFTKTKKLIGRKIRNVKTFQKVLLQEEILDAISAIDELEESFEDILIFDITPNFRSYDESLTNEMADLEGLKDDVISDVEMKISDYSIMSDEEAFEMIFEMIENSKALAEKYLKSFINTINNLTRKLTVISHIFVIENRMKKFYKHFENYQENLKNFPNLITVDNAKRILIENFESLEFFLEESFQNPQLIVDKIRSMNRQKPSVRSDKCPSISSSNSSDGIYVDDEPKTVESKKEPSNDCFFVKTSSVNDTRVDSIIKLETNLEKLDEKIESIQDEKLNIKQQLCMKKKKLQEAILKVIEFEVKIEELEVHIEENLQMFQSKIFSLESKLMDNFKGPNDPDIKNLLESEINHIKSEFERHQTGIQKTCHEFVTQAQTFAFTLGPDIVDDFRVCHCDLIQDSNNQEEIKTKKEEFSKNRKRLEKLLARPTKFCRDENGERFYLNSKGEKIFQLYPHSSQYAIDVGEIRMKIKNGIPLQNDEKGEFYVDSMNCKIYTKNFFENEHGRYYIDIHGDRHYQTDPEASEYKLVNGEWIKVKDGCYETDEKGLRKWPEPSEDSIEIKRVNLDEILDFSNLPGKGKITQADINYIKQTVGPAIIKGLAAVSVHQPEDPVKYFANFLLHYQFTQAFFQQREAELNFFLELRKQIKDVKCDKNV